MPVKKGLIQLYDAKALVVDLIAQKIEENGEPPTFDMRYHRMSQKAQNAGPSSGFLSTGIEETATRNLSPAERLWLAVLEQTIFDAYLHSTGGNYQSIAWVKDARRWFATNDFEWICEQLGIEVDWARQLIGKLEQLAKRLRGREYEQAVKSRNAKRQARLHPQGKVAYVR